MRLYLAAGEVLFCFRASVLCSISCNDPVPCSNGFTYLFLTKSNVECKIIILLLHIPTSGCIWYQRQIYDLQTSLCRTNRPQQIMANRNTIEPVLAAEPCVHYKVYSLGIGKSYKDWYQMQPECCEIRIEVVCTFAVYIDTKCTTQSNFYKSHFVFYK